MLLGDDTHAVVARPKEASEDGLTGGVVHCVGERAAWSINKRQEHI